MTAAAVAEWHAIRARHCGASEVAALFCVSPYMTYWQLWQIKAGRMAAPDLAGDERVMAGTYLEPAMGCDGKLLRKLNMAVPGATASTRSW